MKKLLLICVIIAVVVLAVVPVSASAEASNSNLCLINPIAIVAIGNDIFVADNVDEPNGESVLLCFDISQNNPVYKYTYALDDTVVNLSQVNGQLCVVMRNGVQFFDVAAQGLVLDEDNIYAEGIENAADVTYGRYVFAGQAFNTVYYIGEMLQFSDGIVYRPVGLELTPNAIACEEFGNFIYYMYVKDGETLCKRFDTERGATMPGDPFNRNLAFGEQFVPKGMFVYTLNGEDHIGMFNQSSIYYLQQPDSTHYAVDTALFDYALLSHETGKSIDDVCYGADKIFVLNSANQIEVFAHNGSSYYKVMATIGTDTISVNHAIPTTFTGFTLVKSSGYPTNIIYKTADVDTSVSEIITDNTEQFIILDFDGAADIPFYYVLIGDRFGWVKKSDGVKLPSEDVALGKLKILDTKVSSDVSYKAKFRFTSLNSVFIYPLPVSGFAPCDTLKQTISDPQEVDLLQKFVETTTNGTVDWYYISYANGTKRGFIQSGNIGQFYSTSSISSDVPVEGVRKINSSLFEAVKVYFSSSMLESQVICNEQGDPVKLYSGDFVTAVRQEGNATFIEIKQNDGTTSYGWMPSENLIGQHEITTNAVVGLSILGAAIVVSVVFALIFLRRKKIKLEKQEESQQ